MSERNNFCRTISYFPTTQNGDKKKNSRKRYFLQIFRKFLVAQNSDTESSDRKVIFNIKKSMFTFHVLKDSKSVHACKAYPNPKLLATQISQPTTQTTASFPPSYTAAPSNKHQNLMGIAAPSQLVATKIWSLPSAQEWKA